MAVFLVKLRGLQLANPWYRALQVDGTQGDLKCILTQLTDFFGSNQVLAPGAGGGGRVNSSPLAVTLLTRTGL